MRVTVLVTVGVVPAMGGDPEQDRPLGRHATGDQHQAAHQPRGLERTMGQVTVVAHGNPEHLHRVEHREEDEIQGMDLAGEP